MKIPEQTRKVSPAVAIISFLLAIIGNVAGWIWIGNNANERYPVGVFITCIVACALAGFITGRNPKWLAGAAVFGAILAAMLVFMV